MARRLRTKNTEMARYYAEAIAEFMLAHRGRFPKTREFMLMAGFQSTCTADAWLDALIKLGYVAKDRDTSAGRPRYYLVGAQWHPPLWYRVPNTE